MDAKAEKRVALAEDVLAKIETREIRPNFGAYVLVDAAGCKACALGSMLVACCGRPARSMASNPVDLIECLYPLFSVGELAIIEAAFEGNNGMPMASEARLAVESSLLDKDDFEQSLDAAAAAFGDPPENEGNETVLRSAENRLHDIMANIIVNDGEFRPEQL